MWILTKTYESNKWKTWRFSKNTGIFKVSNLNDSRIQNSGENKLAKISPILAPPTPRASAKIIPPYLGLFRIFFIRSQYMPSLFEKTSNASTHAVRRVIHQNLNLTVFLNFFPQTQVIEWLFLNIRSLAFILHHFTGCPPADFHRKVCPPVPGIDLAHAGKI